MIDKEKALIEAKANVLKALGHPTRLWMAGQLAEGEKCVCEFVDADFSTISKHLSVLKQAGVAWQDGLLQTQGTMHPEFYALRGSGYSGEYRRKSWTA